MNSEQKENNKRRIPPPPPPLKRGPPPPPPGKTTNNQSESIKSGKKLRKVHWELIPAAHVKERTIFQEIQNILSEYQKSSDAQSLYQQFEIKENNNSPETSSVQNNSGGVSGGTSMKLALKRAQTIEIVLKSFKMSQSEICEGVCRLTSEEGSLLSDSQIQELLKCMPNEDEEKSLQAIVRKSLSGPAERFLLLLMSVPYVQERLQFGLFVGQFEEIIRGLKGQIKLLNDACAEVRNSKEVLLLFTVILVVGNILNEGTKIGNAKGFKISSLKQLKGTKTTVGNDKNLLHVILEQVKIESEEVFYNLDQMLPSCKEASEISLKEMEEIIKNTQSYILELQNFADRIDEKDGRNCGLKVRNFYNQAKLEMEGIHGDFVQAKQDFKSLAEYLEGRVYGQGQQPSDLFTNLKMFKEDIKNAKKQIMKRESKENSNIQHSPQTSEISVSTINSTSPAISASTTSNTRKKDDGSKYFKRSDGETINVEDLRKSIRLSMAGMGMVESGGGGENNLQNPSSWLQTEGLIRDRRFQRNISQLSSSQSSPIPLDINQNHGGKHGRKKTQILNQINFTNTDAMSEHPRPAHSPTPQLITTQESTAAPSKTKNISYPSAKKSWLTRSINALKKNLCGFQEFSS